VLRGVFLSSTRFFNKSQVRFFEGHNLGHLENEVNEFMVTTSRIYNVKHSVVGGEEYPAYHFVMVSYEP
jgi:hypothetical protein